MRTMPTITTLALITAELNTAVSLVTPTLARGSNMHPITAYAARYAADQAELTTAMAGNRYTRHLTR